jgi:hypothetical protein
MEDKEQYPDEFWKPYCIERIKIRAARIIFGSAGWLGAGKIGIWCYEQFDTRLADIRLGQGLLIVLGLLSALPIFIGGLILAFWSGPSEFQIEQEYSRFKAGLKSF